MANKLIPPGLDKAGLLNYLKTMSVRYGVKWSIQTAPISGSKQIVAADDSRVLLLMQPMVTSQTVQYGQGGGTNDGILINPQLLPFVLDVSTYGPIVQGAWFANRSTGGSVYVLELYVLP